MTSEVDLKTKESSVELDMNPSTAASTVITLISEKEEEPTEDMADKKEEVLSEDMVDKKEEAVIEVMVDQKQEDTIDDDNSASEAETPAPMFYKPPPKQFALILVALSLCVFLASLDQIIVSTSIPAIALEYNALSDISWLGTAYLMTSTAFQPLYGKVSDIFGRKSTILFANFMFLLGSAISGWATSMTMLIIGRGVAGVGAGGLMAMVFIILSDMLDMRERGKYIGFVSGIFSFSAVIGPLLGGTFADHLTWRWSFWINLPLGAISILFITINLNLPTPKGSFRDKVKRIDFYGSILLMTAVILILLPLSWGGSTYAWSSGIIIGMLCAGFAVVGIFILVEWKLPNEPIVPIHLYKIRNIWSTYGSLFFNGMAFFGLLFYIPIYFQVVKGESATIGGLEIVPFVVGILISSVISGLWAAKRGTFAFFPPLGSFIFIGGCALCILFEQDTKRVVCIFVLLVCGLGMGLTMQASTLAVQSAVKPKHMATVTASVQFMRSLGQVFGVAIVGSVFDNKLQDTLIKNFPNDPTILEVVQDYKYIYTYGLQDRIAIFGSFVHGLHYAFYCCVAFCCLAFFLSCFVQHKELKTNANQAMPETALEIV
ncbi:major facilitator superfamily domain-containing protein [Dissophora ornata]|nr:major facilitator superfamily domain-containing protein [Dissophora ornata]